MTGPRLEDLVSVRFARYVSTYPEDVAARVADRLMEQGSVGATALVLAAEALGRFALTGVVFTVDRDTMIQACASAEPDGPGLHDLPPLPFPRILVEADTDHVWTLGDADGRPDFDLQVACIREEEPGSVWTGHLICADRADHLHRDEDPLGDVLGRYGSDEPTMFHMDFRLTPHSFLVKGKDPHEMPLDHALARFLREAVQFITARGVEHDPIPVHRAERRRAARAGERLPTDLYWVVVRPPSGGSEGTGSGRVYRVRWLVRGHWRRLEERRTWVRSYVKGPPGAPWKGQPVYRRPAG